MILRFCCTKRKPFVVMFGTSLRCCLAHISSRYATLCQARSVLGSWFSVLVLSHQIFKHSNLRKLAGTFVSPRHKPTTGKFWQHKLSTEGYMYGNHSGAKERFSLTSSLLDRILMTISQYNKSFLLYDTKYFLQNK